MEAVGIGIEAGVAERRHGVAVDGVVGGAGVAAQPLENVNLLVLRAEHPERRPQALAVRQFRAHLEVAVGLSEIRFEKTRGIAVAPHLSRLGRADRLGADRQHAAIERKRIQTNRRSGRPLERRACVQLQLAVAGQRKAVQPRSGVAVVGGPIRRDRLRAVEVFGEGPGPEAARVQGQLEVARAELADGRTAKGDHRAAVIQNYVGALLAHRGLNRLE